MSDEPGNNPNVTKPTIRSKNTRKRTEKGEAKNLQKSNGPKYYACTPDPPKLD